MGFPATAIRNESEWFPDRPAYGAAETAKSGLSDRVRGEAIQQRRFQDKLQPCRIAPFDEDMFCGTYRVSEDRGSRDGRTISLNIVVMPATGSEVDPDPVVFLAGGGVVPATRYMGMMNRLFRTLRESRDIVLVDQRGTGKSNPLECPSLRGTPEPATLDSYVAALKACAVEMRKAADTRFYTTPDAMDDLDEVRAWLGYDRVNLMGVSYGTWAAQVYLRKYPAKVRSVVLHGPMPLDVSMFLDIARNAQETLDRVLDACAKDSGCNQAFPDVKSQLSPVLRRLARQPQTIAVKPEDGADAVTVRIDDLTFSNLIYAALASNRSAGDIPMFIHSAFEKRYEPIAQLLAQEVNAPPPAIPLAPKGVFLSLLCAESIPMFTQNDVKGATADTFMGDFQLRSQMAQCSVWPAAKMPKAFWTAVKSDHPALILAGALDHTTPPRYAQHLVSSFSRGRFIELPQRGHMDADLCVAGLITSFIRSASPVDMDAACLAQTPPLRFRGMTRQPQRQ